MSFLICLAALGFLMFVAYRGYSVILFAPIAAMGAVLLTDPAAVPPIFTGLFMERMVVFVKLYFPVFLLGAVFGKVIELSGFSRSIVSAVIGVIGRERAMVSIVAVCCLLTYGGVSLFVVVFAVYPFAAEMFRQSDIPKRLIPGTIALGAFTATMDSFPGTPQIQNIIPTTFFKTTTWAAPILGTFGGLFILAVGLLYLEWRRRVALKAGEGYGTGHINEPEPIATEKLPNPILAMTPLVLVLVMNFIFTDLIKRFYPATVEVSLIPGGSKVIQQTSSVAAIWAVEGALILGIVFVVIFGWKAIASRFAAGSQQAVAGSLLASLNTASEYGFGAVIAALPGFIFIRDALTAIPNPLVNIAISVTVLAGITGSASGGMSIALAAMADQFVAMANAAHIPLEVLHRVASMASGGMDTLPHNGAVITLLNVTGLTHRQSYKDIFAITVIKTTSVFVVIGLYYLTGLV
ncbi:transporter [Rhodoplanes elegans]|uniref:Transporter n=1 Tax=Rhodoplanes elegans TaxID=29408 RepID=A0A327K1C3_9BRAD|nr:GntP family permease [Rhodoplanes elegans]MBK5960378.1 transporter [Rhodoplanes elegans]RAI31072.1 transporter [Rhodoplanes elegans]